MRQRGFTLIELAITVAIFGLLIALAVPNMTTWVQNSQIRTASEAVLAGLNVARSEALRRNSSVRFQLTDTLDSSCTLSATGRNWIVSLADPAGACDIAPDPAGLIAPQTIQKRSSAEGTQNAQISALDGAATPVAASAIVFNGLGRLAATGGISNIATIDISNSAPGAVCQHVNSAGQMRCLRITISGGGNLKLCDPAVTDTTDPRHC